MLFYYKKIFFLKKKYIILSHKVNLKSMNIYVKERIISGMFGVPDGICEKEKEKENKEDIKSQKWRYNRIEICNRKCGNIVCERCKRPFSSKNALRVHKRTAQYCRVINHETSS